MNVKTKQNFLKNFCSRVNSVQNSQKHPNSQTDSILFSGLTLLLLAAGTLLIFNADETAKNIRGFVQGGLIITFITPALFLLFTAPVHAAAVRPRCGNFRSVDTAQINAEIMFAGSVSGKDDIASGSVRNPREEKNTLTEIEPRDDLFQTVNQAANILLCSGPGDFSDTLQKCMGMIARSVNSGRMYLSKNHEGSGKFYFSLLCEWPENTCHYAAAQNDEQTPEIRETLLRGECVHRAACDFPPADRERLAARGVVSVLIVPVFAQNEFWGIAGFENFRGGQLFTKDEEAAMRSGGIFIAEALLRNEYSLNLNEISSELETALSDTRKADNTHNALLARVNHKIRTQLNTVIGLSGLTLNEGNINHEAAENLEKIYRAGSAILDIVNNLPGISGIQSKNSGVHPMRHDSALNRINLSYAHVLLVDDTETNLDVVKEMMKPYGIKTDCASNGREAVEMIRKEEPRYSAIFMDHLMPETDGLETVKIIREETGTDYARKIPIIALTANVATGTEKMFLTHGFQDFIPKPVDMMKLDAVLRRWVRDKKLERDLLNAGEELYLPNINRLDTDEISLPADITVNGVDKNKALQHFGGNEKSFIDVLRSYAANTPGLLVKLREYLAVKNFADYATVVHGIKGSNYGIAAQEAGKAAEAQEIAAKENRFDAVKTGHGAFEKISEDLLDEINKVLGEIDSRIDKPLAAAPNPAILNELREACKTFDISGVDKAMEQLESFKYEKGEKLVAWLREQINGMNFEEITGGVWPSE